MLADAFCFQGTDACFAACINVFIDPRETARLGVPGGWAGELTRRHVLARRGPGG